jgi:hypothetical protein
MRAISIKSARQILPQIKKQKAGSNMLQMAQPTADNAGDAQVQDLSELRTAADGQYYRRCYSSCDLNERSKRLATPVRTRAVGYLRASKWVRAVTLQAKR